MIKNKIFSEIIVNNAKREKKILSKYACRSSKGLRQFPEKEKILDRENIRTIFFHDTDKIIHSRSYARYIDKTQVFYLFENDHITHRVLHVQFVSKIGRVIGRSLRLNEDLIEAISLGHDLGHVPYGHDGEEVLNSICQTEGIGCFSHNAQSVRFLMEIENKGNGLNLSLQVVDGILAHNGEKLEEKYIPDYGKNWKRFQEEYRKCFTQNYSRKINPMTLEGCVVKIADIIAYIGRDIEDAIILGVIKRKDIPLIINKTIGNTNDKIINNLVMDLIKNSYNKAYLSFSKDVFKALKDLMDFNKRNIYSHPGIKTESYKIKKMFEQLFKKYYNDLKDKNKDLPVYEHYLKNFNKEYLKKTDDKRKAIDFLAGMTDDFFNNQFKEIFVPKSYGYFFKKGK